MHKMPDSKNYYTEEELKKLMDEWNKSLPFYTPVRGGPDLKPETLPTVMEGERYRVVSPCFATIVFEILPHHESYKEIYLQPGLELTVGKIYTKEARAFDCLPDNVPAFIARHFEESARTSKHFSGHIRVSIFRYHVGMELEKSA